MNDVINNNVLLMLLLLLLSAYYSLSEVNIYFCVFFFFFHIHALGGLTDDVKFSEIISAKMIHTFLYYN